jgi:hypothetical protein
MIVFYEGEIVFSSGGRGAGESERERERKKERERLSLSLYQSDECLL